MFNIYTVCYYCLKFSFVITLLCWSHFSNSQPKDTLYFYNETKIVGKLLKIRLGRLEFDADGVGIITIKNTKIESINASFRNFRIETVEGRELLGYLTRSDSAGMVLITGVETIEVPVENITSLVYFGQTLRSRFAGNISSGFSYTKSSEIGRWNTDGVVKYNTIRGLTQLGGDMIITYDSVESNTERANLTFSHDHTIAPLWGAVFILKYQRNLELGLERRWQQAFGASRKFLISKHQRALAIGGIAINQERNEENAETHTTEAMFQVNYDLFSFISPNMTLSFYEAVFIGLNEESRTRLDGNISLDYEIITDFYINLQFYHNFDSRSPATNEPNVDYGFVAGLRYKF